MSAQGFFQGALGDPTELVRSVGWQTVVDMPAEDGYVDMINNGGEMSPTVGTIEQANILGGEERGAGVPAAYDVTAGPLNLGDADPASLGQLMFEASLLGKYDATNPSGAHFRFRLGARKATAVPPGLTLIDDSGLGIPTRFRDVKASGMTLDAKSKANLAMVVPIVAGGWDNHGAVAQSVGTGAALPSFGNTWSGNRLPDATDSVIFVKVITAAPDPTTVKVKVGTAALYSGAAISVTAGERAYLHGTTADGADRLIGTRDEQVWLRCDDLADWDVDDVFTLQKRRAVNTSPSYAVQQLVPETMCRIFAGGSEIRADQGVTLTVARGNAEILYAAAAGAQPIGSRVTGFTTVTITIQRSLNDLTPFVAAFNRSKTSVVFEAISNNLITGTAVPYGRIYVAPQCRYDGLRQFSVGVGATGPPTESYVFRAEIPDDDFVYDSLTFNGAFESVWNTNILSPV